MGKVNTNLGVSRTMGNGGDYLCVGGALDGEIINKPFAPEGHFYDGVRYEAHSFSFNSFSPENNFYVYAPEGMGKGDIFQRLLTGYRNPEAK